MPVDPHRRVHGAAERYVCSDRYDLYENLLCIVANFGKQGATHLAWLNTEIFRECYTDGHPYDDYVKITFRNCQIVYCPLPRFSGSINR